MDKEIRIISPKLCGKCGSGLDYSSEFNLIYCPQCDLVQMRRAKAQVVQHVRAYSNEDPLREKTPAIIGRALRDWKYRKAIFTDAYDIFIRFIGSKRPITLGFYSDSVMGDRLIAAVIEARQAALGYSPCIEYIFDPIELENLMVEKRGKEVNTIAVIEAGYARGGDIFRTVIRRHRYFGIDLFFKNIEGYRGRMVFALAPFGADETHARGLVKIDDTVRGFVILAYDGNRILKEWYEKKGRAINELLEGGRDKKGDEKNE